MKCVNQKGVQWCLLKEEEVIPRIRAMEGRRGRPPNLDRQHSREESRMRRRKGRPPNVGSTEFLDNTDAKLLRKLQAQGKKYITEIYYCFHKQGHVLMYMED